MLKASDNPPLTFPEANPVTDYTGQWWVAHTKSRNEKALAQDLIARGVSYFLPMTWNVRRSSERTIRSLLPLFTGYLFFCGKEEHRIEVLRTNRVANIIEVHDQEALINELSQVETALKAGVPIVPEVYIQKGQWVRVKGGALMGLEGVVEDVKNFTRLVLQVNMLGQAAGIEIDIDMIEPIEEPTYKTQGGGPILT